MNITRARQQERKIKIAQMQSSIKASEEPDLDRLVMLCCNDWGISKRTAKEYLKQALFNIGEENGNKRDSSNVETNP